MYNERLFSDFAVKFEKQQKDYRKLGILPIIMLRKLTNGT